MGKQWKKSGKMDQANKKGKIFTKLAKEIIVAAKIGGPETENNARLRMAVDAAKAQSVPKDTIERAIKKGAGLLDDGKIIEEVIYEGYGPHQVAVIVECQTDNRARTAPEVRNIFNKAKGSMGTSGTVAWMFDRVGLLEGLKSGDFDIDEEAIEAEVDDFDGPDEESLFSFYTTIENLENSRVKLTDRGWDVKTCEPSFKPKNMTDLTEEQTNEVVDFLDKLNDLDDVFRVHTSID